MSKISKIFLLFFWVCLLSACSFFDDDSVKPAQLPTFTQKVQLTSVWQNKNDFGTLNNYLKLTPAFVDDKVFTVSYRGVVKATNSKTGADIWTVKTYQPLTSGIALDKQLLFVGTGAGKLLAFDQKDGKFVWQAPVSNDILATPVIADGKVIVKTADGRLFAFNAQNGQKIWGFEEPNQEITLRGSSRPVVFDKLVICGITNGELVALNLDDGQVVWKQVIAEPKGEAAIARMTDIDADPVIVDKTIYVATYQGQFAAVALNGKILWQKALSSYAGFLVGPSTIYAVDAEGHIWAFSRSSGEKIWEQEGLNNRSLSTPAIYKDYLVVGDFEGYIHLIALKDGKIYGRIRADRSEIIVPPIAWQNGLYIETSAGRLIKYN